MKPILKGVSVGWSYARRRGRSILTISLEHSVMRYMSPSTPCCTVTGSTPSFSVVMDVDAR